MPRYDDYIPNREEREAIPSGEVVVKSNPSQHVSNDVFKAISLGPFEEQNPQIEKGSCH